MIARNGKKVIETQLTRRNESKKSNPPTRYLITLHTQHTHTHTHTHGNTRQNNQAASKCKETNVVILVHVATPAHKRRTDPAHTAISARSFQFFEEACRARGACVHAGLTPRSAPRSVEDVHQIGVSSAKTHSSSKQHVVKHYMKSNENKAHKTTSVASRSPH